MALEEKLNKGKPVQMIQEEDPKEGLQCLASLSQGPQWDRALSLGVALLLPMWWQWLCLSIQKLCLKGTLSPAELTPSWKCWETGNLINLLGVIPDLLTLLSSLSKWVLHPSKGNMEGGLFTISEFTPNDQALGWYCASVPNSQGFEKTQWGLRRAVKAGLYLGLSSGGNCCSEHKWVSQSKLIKTKADNVSCFVFLPLFFFFSHSICNPNCMLCFLPLFCPFFSFNVY